MRYSSRRPRTNASLSCPPPAALTEASVEIADPVKRRVERVQFFQPLPARFGVAPVALSDLTSTGAGIQHQAQIPRGEDHSLRFSWLDHDVTVSSHIVRTRLECYRLGGASLTLYRSGLHFVDPPDEQATILRKIITGKVARALEEQRANAYALTRDDVMSAAPGTFEDAKPAFNLNDFFSTAVQEHGYIRCTFVAGRWTRTWTESH